MATAQTAQPRQEFYSFAHRVLKQDAHTEPKLWSIITGDRAHSYLQMRWHDAGGAPEPSLLPVALQKVGELEIQIVNMPEPQAPTEAYFAAFVRSPAQPFPLRYFVCERSTTGGAFWSEWRPDMRIRGADVPMWPADTARRAELPAPYLAAFVDAIVAEAHASPATVAAAPTPPPMAARPAPVPTKRSGPTPLQLAMIVIPLIVIAAIFLMSRR